MHFQQQKKFYDIIVTSFKTWINSKKCKSHKIHMVKVIYQSEHQFKYRTKAKKDFEKDHYTFLNNSVFARTIQNNRKQRDT